jgi:hypothetical protein
MIAPTQKQDWIKEQTRHVDDINDLLDRLDSIIDRIDPEGNDSQLDKDSLLIESALQHYREYWRSQANQIAEM